MAGHYLPAQFLDFDARRKIFELREDKAGEQQRHHAEKGKCPGPSEYGHGRCDDERCSE